MTDHEKIEELEDRLHKAANTVQALQLVLWNLCQMDCKGPMGAQMQHALIGLGDVLEDQLVS